MEQFKWNYILDDDADEDLKDEDDGEDDKDNSDVVEMETTPPAHQQQAIKSANTMQ